MGDIMCSLSQINRGVVYELDLLLYITTAEWRREFAMMMSIVDGIILIMVQYRRTFGVG